MDKKITKERGRLILRTTIAIILATVCVMSIVMLSNNTGINGRNNNLGLHGGGGGTII